MTQNREKCIHVTITMKTLTNTYKEMKMSPPESMNAEITGLELMKILNLNAQKFYFPPQ